MHDEEKAFEFRKEFPESKRVEHMGFGLYGLTVPTESLEKVFDRVVAFFRQLGCAPTQLGSGKLDSAGKSLTYTRGLKRWRAHSMEAEYFQVISVPDDVEHHLEAQNAAASWTRDKNLVVTFCPDRVGEHTPDLLELAREIAAIGAPRYGMIYRVPFCFGPIEYGIGLCYNNASQSVGGWSMGVLRFGLYRYLRNIYRWNFLTDIHLNALVNGQRLEDWIKHGPRRGKLEPFVGTMTQWTVPEEEIPAVRKTLDEAGLFFEYERDINQTCWKYRCSEQEAAEYLRTGKEPRYNPPDPNKPPLDMDDVLRSLGVGEGDREVLRVEPGGKLQKLTPAEVQKIAAKGAKSARKGPKRKG